MYKKEFDIYLAKTTPKASLLYGESNFFIDFYSKKITQKIPDANITTFYFADYELNAVLDILSQGSLFGDISIVILKIDTKLSKKEIDSMLGAIQITDNYLIVNFYQSENKTSIQYAQDCRSIASAFKGDNIVEVRFFAPSLADSLMILRQRAKELHLELNDGLLQFILHIQNNDLSLAYNELQKYENYDEPITQELIQKLSYGLGSISIDDFLDVFFEKKDFLPTYEKMQEEGVDSNDILRELERYFYILFMFSSYIKVNGKENAKEILGYQPPKFIVDKYVRRMIKLKENHFQRIFEILRDWRNQTFRGDKTADIRALIKIKAFL
ncbi:MULTISPECIES: DNA polymerase III subunit delta [unclassified Helicobacter]|uniref:DNA polymerase III subunit delta n=1 Tax=unclassified Helicobacter TaxID=2593540 RepID=UPI000CF06220|nr:MULTISPECIES: DNA polymerase III subunit delta [unclassified Helicobacter]